MTTVGGSLAPDENRLYLVVMPNTKPLIAAAFLCENVLVEKDGVLTAVRIIDRFTVEYGGTDEALVEAGLGLELTLLVMVKSGDLRGKYDLTLRMRAPDGRVALAGELQVDLKGDEEGANWIAKLKMPIRVPGLFWIDVYFEEDLLTSVPLRITLERLSEKSPAGE